MGSGSFVHMPVSVDFPGVGSFFVRADNDILSWRASTFLSKEPGTLEWLKSLEPDSLLIDVGANVGMYSIPAAKYLVRKVVAIEPEPKNLQVLRENSDLNELTEENLNILPLAISTEFADSVVPLFLAQDKSGGSCHQLARNQSTYLKPVSKKRKCISVYAVSLASIVRRELVSHQGNIHVKIDVDGIEKDVCDSLFEERLISQVSSLQIELNPVIDQHKILIKKLHQAGFDFDPRKVEKALRREGPFAGFAEYIFRRKLYCGFVSALGAPSSSATGSCVDVTSSSENQNTGIVYSFKSGIPLSRLPASFALREIWDVQTISAIGHRVAQMAISTEAEVQKFDAEKIASTGSALRRKIKKEILNKCSKSYLIELEIAITEFVSSGGLAEIFFKGCSYLYRRKFLKNHFESLAPTSDHIVCRIRHFVDLKGYSLAHHNDSSDTLMALIAPLIPWSTATSLISGGAYDRGYAAFQSADLIERNTFLANRFFGSFGDQTYCEYIAKNGTNEFALNEVPCSISRLELSPGEALLLPNILKCSLLPRRAVDKEMRLKEILGHSVCPPVEEVYRPVLLADFITVPSGDQLASDESAELIIPLTSVTDFINQIIEFI